MSKTSKIIKVLSIAQVVGLIATTYGLVADEADAITGGMLVFGGATIGKVGVVGHATAKTIKEIQDGVYDAMNTTIDVDVVEVQQ